MQQNFFLLILIYLVYLITITSERQVSTLMKYSLMCFVVVPRIAGKYIMDTCTQTTETELRVSFHLLIIRKGLREIKETGVFYLQHVLHHLPVNLGAKQRKTQRKALVSHLSCTSFTSYNTKKTLCRLGWSCLL